MPIIFQFNTPIFVPDMAMDMYVHLGVRGVHGKLPDKGFRVLYLPVTFFFQIFFSHFSLCHFDDRSNLSLNLLFASYN